MTVQTKAMLGVWKGMACYGNAPDSGLLRVSVFSSRQ